MPRRVVQWGVVLVRLNIIITIKCGAHHYVLSLSLSKIHLSIANVWVKLPPEFPRPLVHLERQGGLFREKIKYYFAEIDLPKFSELLDPWYTWEDKEDFFGKWSHTILRTLPCLNFWNY